MLVCIRTGTDQSLVIQRSDQVDGAMSMLGIVSTDEVSFRVYVFLYHVVVGIHDDNLCVFIRPPLELFALQNKDEDIRRWLFLEFLDCSTRGSVNLTNEERCTVLKDILDPLPPEIVEKLADCSDPNGRNAIEITDAKTKLLFVKKLYFCERFEVLTDEAFLFKSDTSIVAAANDHIPESANTGKSRKDPVVIKFMKLKVCISLVHYFLFLFISSQLLKSL